MSKIVEKMSKDKINAELGATVLGDSSSPKADFSVAQNVSTEQSLTAKPKQISNDYYISKLCKNHSDKIKSWFEPFGYINHEYRPDLHFMIVTFNNFFATINDYNIELTSFPITQESEEPKKYPFKHQLFADTAHLMDTNFEQIFENYVAIKLSETFDSYQNARYSFKNEQMKNAIKYFKSNIDEKDKDSQKLVSVFEDVKDMQEILNQAIRDRGYYGTFLTDKNKNQ